MAVVAGRLKEMEPGLLLLRNDIATVIAADARSPRNGIDRIECFVEPLGSQEHQQKQPLPTSLVLSVF